MPDGDGLVEYHVFELVVQGRLEPGHKADASRPRRRRVTLTDRLVAATGSDRVVVDLVSLESDLEALRSAPPDA